MLPGSPIVVTLAELALFAVLSAMARRSDSSTYGRHGVYQVVRSTGACH